MIIKYLKQINQLNYPVILKRMANDPELTDWNLISDVLYEYQFLEEIFPISMRDRKNFDRQMKQLTGFSIHGEMSIDDVQNKNGGLGEKT